MRIVVLGHKGMLGNAVHTYFSKKPGYLVQTVTSRWGDKQFEKELRDLNPDLIINCIGIIPQKKLPPELYTQVNVNLPKFLETLNIHILHPSTDCEFEGTEDITKQYTKQDERDASDNYGKSKAEISKLIETTFKNTKIIRTSIIGHELNSHLSLLDWFLNAEGPVNGYTNHYWNGITTLEWAKRAHTIIEDWESFPTLNQFGTEHNASKYDLLSIIKTVYKKNTVINPIETPKTVNKCLRSDIAIADIKAQLEELRVFYNK